MFSFSFFFCEPHWCLDGLVVRMYALINVQEYLWSPLDGTGCPDFDRVWPGIWKGYIYFTMEHILLLNIFCVSFLLLSEVQKICISTLDFQDNHLVHVFFVLETVFKKKTHIFSSHLYFCKISCSLFLWRSPILLYVSL